MSFATVAIAYTAYALVAVPLIEPSVALAPPRPKPVVPERLKPFEHLFPTGAWELDRPKILETEQGTLLFDDYRPSKDGRTMRLNRCTLIRYLGPGKAVAGKGSALPE